MIFSIFTNVALTFAPLFPTMPIGISLVKRLLEAFFTAFAIALGVNLFVIPVSSRTVVFKEAAGFIMTVRGVIKANTVYLQSLETDNMFSGEHDNTVNDTGNVKTDNERPLGTDSPKTMVPEKKPLKVAETAEAKVLKSSIAGLIALHGKLYGDLPFGKREVAWGKLCADDIEEIFRKFQAILVPL